MLNQIDKKVKILENTGKMCEVCFENGIIKKIDIELLNIAESGAFDCEPRFHFEIFPLQG